MQPEAGLSGCGKFLWNISEVRTMKTSLCCFGETTTLVYPVQESLVARYAYYATEILGHGDDRLFVRELTQRDFVPKDFRCRIAAQQLEERIKSLDQDEIFRNLRYKARERIKAAEGNAKIGIAAIVKAGEDRFAAVPVDCMSITGAGMNRMCIVRMALDNVRYAITDSRGAVQFRADPVQLRGMLLAPYDEDMRRFSMEVPLSCLADAGKGVYALLPEVPGTEDRLLLHCSKRSVMYRKLRNTAWMDIKYSANLEIRSLRRNRVYSIHGSLVKQLLKSKLYYSDRLRTVSVSAKAVEKTTEDGLELRMPQMWHVMYKDSMLFVPWTAVQGQAKKAEETMQVMLCAGMYGLREDGREHLVCMEDLADALDGNEYRTEPRMYVKVPYKAVFRCNSSSVCIGLVLSDSASRRKRPLVSDFSCIMKLDRRYYMDERPLGGSIWVAVPVGHRFEAWITDSDIAVELGITDVMRLLGALQKDLESLPSDTAGAAKRTITAA